MTNRILPLIQQQVGTREGHGSGTYLAAVHDASPRQNRPRIASSSAQQQSHLRGAALQELQFLSHNNAQCWITTVCCEATNQLVDQIKATKPEGGEPTPHEVAHFRRPPSCEMPQYNVQEVLIIMREQGV